MANFTNYQESKAAMLLVETQQRGIGTKPAAANDGDTSVGEPPSPLLNIGGVGASGARFHQHLPPSSHHHYPQSSLPKGQQHPLSHHYQAATEHHLSVENITESPVRKASSSSLNLVQQDPAASHHALAASVNAASAAIQLAANANVSVATSEGVVDDIQKCGYLRKQKHGHKRFFVLRAASHLGLSRLEYYDSEKKFRNSLRSAAAAAANGTVAPSPPKRVIYLYQCFTVNKRADSKNKHLIALYTKDEYFAIVAENEQEQDDWYVALSELMSEGKKGHLDSDELDDGYGTVTPGTVFKEVWQVNVKPKGLGQTKNLTGVYRLCLSTKTIHLVKLNSETPCVNLQLMNIRRCGHSESFFFMEVGRSSSIGPGEIWMQVDDSVVAQNMHETILETMKALKAFAEIRPRSKSQSSGSNPIAFITTRRHLGNLPPSQTGLQRRSRTESVVGTPPSSKSSGASGYRFRTSSEGEGTMNRPFRSVTGSLIHLNTARIHLGRQEGGVGAGNTGSTGVVGRYARALPGSTYHARSASLPVSHFPSTTSPVSVSSSSGHGSVSDTLTRPSSASICGSPSDGGFNSSDEYGSSPGDFRYFRVRSNTPDSLGNTPPIREENCMSDYMAMGWHREVFGAASGGGSSSGSVETPNRDESTSTDDNRSLRRRTHSFTRPGGQGGVAGGSSGVTVYQKMTQTTFSLDESVSVGEALSLGRTDSITQPSSSSSSLRSDYSSCSEHSQGRPPPSLAKEDSGYMPMLCGVAASPCDAPDYMPMQPSSPSLHHHHPQPSHSPQAPRSAQQPTDPRGYMMMLPGGRSSSSPVQASPSPHSSSSNMGLGGGSVSSSGSIVERPENGEYMDMSYSSSGGGGGDAAGGRKFSNEGGYYALSNPEGRDPKSYSYSPYFSLPRSYKAPAAREREQREREQREREQREREQREREQREREPREREPREREPREREPRAHDEYVPMSSPAKPVYSQVATGNVAERGVTTRGIGSGGSDTPHILPHAYPPPPYGVHHQAANGDRRTTPVRPNRLPLGRRSFHGSLRVSEPDAAEVLSSPGEYINIEFGGRYGPPTSCPLSAQDGSPSVGSAEQRRSPPHPHPQNQDYMSVEVGVGGGGGGDDGGRLAKNKSPRPSLVAPWNPPSYIRPLAAGASVSGAPGSSGARWRTGTDDYTDMTFNLSRGEESRGLRSSPTAMLQHLCLMESCYPPTSASPPSSSPQPEPIKVVRADPQGRRRHSSETFSSSSTSGGGGATSSSTNPSAGSANPSALNVAHLAESSKWTGSGSFDSVWMCVEGIGGDSAGLPARPGPSDLGMASASSVCPPGGRMCRNMSVGYQNGLNYIALELREDRDSNPLPVPQQQQGGTGHGTGATPNAPHASNLTVPVAEDSGAYGSIDFIKSDGMTATSKD
ncbi:insulin receptor substrate 2-B [Salvelinus sp. IW2-2015]|uniref:insulin receptor substrate 2-B n=1 Tax=Salvelinus sp. IW2-2015 TaxID=2691554 RepID=UPI000CEA943F|nr:insulin receptor substrate 2-B-like [Salvelinus alpinus]